MSRRGTRSPLDRAQQRRLRRLLVHGLSTRGVGKEPRSDLNRERKLDRVRAGTAHAALVFDGDDCLGWCQFGAPCELPRIKSRAAYEKGVTTSPDWRIACNFVGKGHRRRGVATAALAGAIELIAGLGGGTVEGYPEDETGACRLPVQRCPLDLREVRLRPRPKIGKHRWVVTQDDLGPRLGSRPARP